ncbi:hypothetical protein C5S35_02630 [Candidatus Methanophagaceae archaeon]|nr:hypothetical protein C5S35_02630 [Methanophagales archaeon]
MNIITKGKALGLLERSIKEENIVSYETESLWKTWARIAKVRTEGIFGLGSRQAEELDSLVHNLFRADQIYQRKSYGKSILALLTSSYIEIQEFWSDEGVEEVVEPISEVTKDEKVGVGPT